MNPCPKKVKPKSGTAISAESAKPQIVHLAALKPDPQNARKRTERSSALIEGSLSEFGAARSIVIDETGRVLAGNGTVEAAASIGIEQVLIVPADGNTLVAVQRTDLDERQKRRYAIADNRASDLSEWDAATLADLVADDPDLNLDSYFTDAELDRLMGELHEEEEEEGQNGDGKGELEVKLTFQDTSDFDTFLGSLQQLSSALPKIHTTEQRLQFVLDQFLKGG